MPATVAPVKGGYRVSTPNAVHAKRTTKAKAESQARLLNALDHGWKPSRKAEGTMPRPVDPRENYRNALRYRQPQGSPPRNPGGSTPPSAPGTGFRAPGPIRYMNSAARYPEPPHPTPSGAPPVPRNLGAPAPPQPPAAAAAMNRPMYRGAYVSRDPYQRRAPVLSGFAYHPALNIDPRQAAARNAWPGGQRRRQRYPLRARGRNPA